MHIWLCCEDALVNFTERGKVRLKKRKVFDKEKNKKVKAWTCLYCKAIVHSRPTPFLQANEFDKETGQRFEILDIDQIKTDLQIIEAQGSNLFQLVELNEGPTVVSFEYLSLLKEKVNSIFKIIVGE